MDVFFLCEWVPVSWCDMKQELFIIIAKYNCIFNTNTYKPSGPHMRPAFHSFTVLPHPRLFGTPNAFSRTTAKSEEIPRSPAMKPVRAASSSRVIFLSARTSEIVSPGWMSRSGDIPAFLATIKITPPISTPSNQCPYSTLKDFSLPRQVNHTKRFHLFVAAKPAYAF